MKVIWAECMDDKVLNRLGEDYSPCRWKSWSDRFAYYDSSLDVLSLDDHHVHFNHQRRL